jgi:hypothetical protein
MPYELRLDHKTVEVFASSDEALDRVRHLLKTQPDSQPEIRDTTTGKPFAPAASEDWRADLAGKVGF